LKNFSKLFGSDSGSDSPEQNGDRRAFVGSRRVGRLVWCHFARRSIDVDQQDRLVARQPGKGRADAEKRSARRCEDWHSQTAAPARRGEFGSSSKQWNL